MAIAKKNNQKEILKEGYYIGKIIKYEDIGFKPIENMESILREGYITFQLEDNTEVIEYMLLAPWKSYLFYKLLQATREKFDIENECIAFNSEDIIGKEVIIQTKQERKNGNYHTNIKNVYNVKFSKMIFNSKNNI